MKEIPGNKKLEVAQCYILGLTYKEIEVETGVSHGSIANIVKELESGKLDILGTPFDQVIDLRELSLDLKKKGLSSSQALLGVSFFERIHNLGIVPEHLDHWAELMSKLTTIDFPAEDFLNAALRLHQLEKSEGKTCEVLIGEYEKAKESVDQLATEISSLAEKKTILSTEVVSISSQLEGLKKTKGKLENEVDGLTIKVKDLKSKADENRAENQQLVKEVRQLKRSKVKLSSEVDGKEESLIRLNDIGFLDEDLLRLRAFIERIAIDSGVGQKEVKEGFLVALGTFKDITEMQKYQAAETEVLKNLTKERATLTGEIAGLTKHRDTLRGEIEESASSAVKEITDTGEKAVIQLRQQAEGMKGQLDGLVVQALRVAGVIGEMNAMIKKGEESGKSLNSFIEEVRVKLEKS